MEITRGIILYRGYIRHGLYSDSRGFGVLGPISGLYREKGKENRKYYFGLRV